MSAFFNLTLDTTAPSGVKLTINNGAIYTASSAVTLGISCTDKDTTGYSMKIWGSVLDVATEADAEWENYNTEKAITLSDTDGLKTIYLKVRDNVWNESTAVSAKITLNTTIPVVTITGPDVSIISKVTGRNTSIIGFTADQDFMEYKVGIVAKNTSEQSECTVIGTAGGSKNTSGTGDYKSADAISVNIIGSDFATAAGGSDGTYIVKVFVKNNAGTWSK